MEKTNKLIVKVLDESLSKYRESLFRIEEMSENMIILSERLKDMKSEIDGLLSLIDRETYTKTLPDHLQRLLERSFA